MGRAAQPHSLSDIFIGIDADIFIDIDAEIFIDIDADIFIDINIIIIVAAARTEGDILWCVWEVVLWAERHEASLRLHAHWEA